jgi:hypothetical protein
MIYKYDFSVLGDNFYPSSIIDKIEGDFLVDSYFSPTDKNERKPSEEYGFGCMSFWHPKKFSTENRIVEYDLAFIEFIEKNYSMFVENGVNDLQIFIEIYFDGGQCNFEIFDKHLLKKLVQFGASLPISVYILKKRELRKWENEINMSWEE